MLQAVSLPQNVTFTNSDDFQQAFAASQQAFLRCYDAVEHYCAICCRELLGDKFFFLSGCEHQFCKQCLIEMVTDKITNGQVQHIVCAQTGCGK